MTDFEKLGVFYLGRLYDMQERARRDDLLLYDAKDLTTHAVCVGMTGSGKTGLCLSLIEEAAIDNIPAILIDPKGDLANLLLTFPNLSPKEFEPWVNPAEAENKGMTVEAYAEAEAAKWSKGLADWGQDGARIQRLRDAVEMAVYTPGSSAGQPVSVLNSFAVPDAATLADPEALHDRIGTTVASLLGLVGIQADPIQSRETILLTTILDRAWRAGENMDLARLITQVQKPPIAQIGVLDMETFYPEKERFGLVMALNNLLASPGFQAWLTGTPLDIKNLLYTATGKPRLAIFSIAHLSDNERMFFVALLLNQIVGWVRTLAGTTSLRALVYMDEIFGYFPPTANPPSKQPLLTLLKQARAYGVGVVLATQNPVDLDYKGLANCGTWFIGRLQAERDKARLLDGLESVNAGAGHGFDRAAIDKTLSSLSSRVFLLNNVHEDAPVTFQTRWALSYLAGPLTQDAIRNLKNLPSHAGAAAPATAAEPAPAPSAVTAPMPVPVAPVPVAEPAPPEGLSRTPPLAQNVKTYYLPVRGRSFADKTLVYTPLLLGMANVRYEDKKSDAAAERKLTFLTEITDRAVPVDWANAETVEIALDDLEQQGDRAGFYAALPAAAGRERAYAGWGRDLVDWLYGTATLTLHKSARLGITARPDEDERDFRLRLTQAAREARDAAVEKLRVDFADERAKLEERIRKAEQAKQREAEQARDAQMQTVVSLGSTLLNAFLGRKKITQSTLSKAATTARGVGRAFQQGQDVNRADENIEVLKTALNDLNARFLEETRVLESQFDTQTEVFEQVTLKPLKKNITVQLVALVWAPQWEDAFGNRQPAWS